jgi:hypothetical protein
MKVALVLGAVVALSLVPGGSAAGVFNDPVGDQVPFEDLVAPDITTVEVVNTRDGLIGFRVAVANYSELPPRSTIAILFDLDRTFATGDSGFEYAASHRVDAAGEHRVVLERWEEEAFEMVEVTADGLSSTFEAGFYTLLVPRLLLENTTAFDFGLYAALFHPTRENRAAVDSAPNANIWTYELEGLPPPRLAASTLVTTPRRPIAGRQFMVSAVVTRRDTGMTVQAASGTVTCTARVGATRLRARGVFRSRNARCLIAIPRTAKGRLLTGAITVRSGGAAVTKRFSFRVA